MHGRIKKLRKTLDLTQQEFADRLNVKRNTIATYEAGRNKPIDAVLSLICHEFNVNEHWLRTGEGNMFIEQTRDEQISDFIEKVQIDDNPFKKRLISILAEMTEVEWGMLEKLIVRLQDEGTEQEPAVEKTEMSVEEAEAAYIKSRSNSARNTGLSVSNGTGGTDFMKVTN